MDTKEKITFLLFVRLAIRLFLFKKARYVLFALSNESSDSFFFLCNESEIKRQLYYIVEFRNISWEDSLGTHRF